MPTLNYKTLTAEQILAYINENDRTPEAKAFLRECFLKADGEQVSLLKTKKVFYERYKDKIDFVNAPKPAKKTRAELWAQYIDF